jgi:hypothetical protein
MMEHPYIMSANANARYSEMVQTAQTHNRLKSIQAENAPQKSHTLAVLGDYLIAAGRKIREWGAADVQQPV